MTITQLELAQNRLFGANGMGVTNLKFYPGTDRDTTVEKFAEQINKAISQVEAGDFEEVDCND